jgi:hypothetical protein
MWLITDQIKSKQCHFDVNRFSTSLMYDSQAYMLLAPWPVCFMDWWIQTWNLLHKQGSRNQLYALCPMARSWMPLSPLKIQRGLHDISILITLFLLMTLKSTTIDLPDHLHYLTYLSLSGVSTKQFAMQCFYWYSGQCIFGVNHRKQYTVCVHECYYSLFTCQSRSLCSFISKSLSTVGQGKQMHPGSLPKNHSVQHLLSWCWCKYWIYSCVWQHKTNQ